MPERFNPYGLHAIHIPLALLTYDGATGTRKSLSWGAKVFYGRLALFLGRPKADEFCNPSLETMSAAMGISVDTVGRWLRELGEHEFVQRVRRGRGPAECIFLPHPCLTSGSAEYGPDAARMRNQGGFNSAGSRRKDETPTPQSAPPDSATSPCQFRNSAAPTPQHCGSLNKEENIQEDIHENVQENTSDSCRDLRKNRANACQPSRDSSSEKHPGENPDERRILRAALAKHLGQIIGLAGELLTPDDDALDGVLAALGDSPVAAFVNYLRNLPATYQRGGRGAPRGWGWFISTARNFAGQWTPTEPTADRCKHNQPYGTCCMSPAEFNSMTDAIEIPGRDATRDHANHTAPSAAAEAQVA
jgi:hypothetical protein